MKNNDDPLTERIKNFKTLSSKDVDKERGFDEIINSPIYKEFVISKDGKTSGILVYIKTDKKFGAAKVDLDTTFNTSALWITYLAPPSIICKVPPFWIGAFFIK